MFILYAKQPGKKRFHPVDWTTGNVVVNRIHATLFSADTAAKMKEDLPAMMAANPGWAFELRGTK